MHYKNPIQNLDYVVINNARMANTAKRLKENHEGDQDRISALPESILHHILSFLELKQAIKSSILSSKWRYVWTSLPFLYFDFGLFETKNLKQSKAKSFEKFVDRVFQLRDTSSVIERLNLNCSGFISPDPQNLINSIYTWILIGLKRKVKELYLDVPFGPKHFKLPSYIFMCESLTKLELRGSAAPQLCIFLSNLPNAMSLPRLESLVLQSVQFGGDDTPNNLFSKCPVLESLTITHCVFQSNLVITSPKLKHLMIDLYFPGTNKKDSTIKLNTPSLLSFRCKDYMSRDYYVETYLSVLVKAELDMTPGEFDANGILQLEGNSRSLYEQRMMKLLKAFHTIEDLTLSVWFFEINAWDCSAIYPVYTTSMCNLRCLRLGAGLADRSLKMILNLLMNSLQIESLVIEINKAIFTTPPSPYWDEVDLTTSANYESLWETQEPYVQYMMHELKFAEVRGVQGRLNELVLLQFLLKQCTVLEKVLIYLVDEQSPNTKRKATKFFHKLASFPRASSTSAILCV
ncbi:hypothetical protein C5167_039356 [Papaver somniferum]|uniref:F-box domain-containing protein n=1 Tax=Papaver somniferum TaxID=3469 RepID=A0A4Y7IG45_PAPSO|nr:F-box/LRR-repeat protein At3g59190-like [Papaver somniferum]RZC46405.1 hypothetical protein C5167_039356 [Papaver somniferum]